MTLSTHERIPDKDTSEVGTSSSIDISTDSYITPTSNFVKAQRQGSIAQAKYTPKIIISRRVFEIPPITNCPTASNISFEKGGELKVEEPCINLAHLSSVTRGVKSGPLEDVLYPAGNTEKAYSNVETVPMLSPKMESDLLQESWALPQNIQEMTTTPSPVSFNWEENFQDLSGWCMDLPIPFQEPCDFLIGEEAALKISDTKMDGNQVSIIQEGDVKGASSVESRQFTTVDGDTSGSKLSDVLVIPTPQQIKYEELTQHQNTLYVPEEANVQDVWLNLLGTSDSTNHGLPNIIAEDVAQHPLPWITNVDPEEDDTTSNHHKSLVNIDVDETYTGKLGSNKNHQDTWEKVICPKKNSEFDLLSYLSDDKIFSSVSDDATRSSLVPESTAMSTLNNIRSNNPRTVQPVRKRSAHYSVASTSSSASTSSLSSTLSSVSTTQTCESFSKRASRTSNRHKTSYEQLVKKEPKPSRRGVKRYAESESEDDCTSDYSYRESRDKNNEASRRSRMNKKVKEKEMNKKAIDLEKDNRILKMKVEELEKVVISMRTALLNTALKKDFRK